VLVYQRLRLSAHVIGIARHSACSVTLARNPPGLHDWMPTGPRSGSHLRPTSPAHQDDPVGNTIPGGSSSLPGNLRARSELRSVGLEPLRCQGDTKPMPATAVAAVLLGGQMSKAA
jgi:hypothetical protein